MRHVVGVEVDSNRYLTREEIADLIKSFEYFMRTTYGLGINIVTLYKVNALDSGKPVE